MYDNNNRYTLYINICYIFVYIYCGLYGNYLVGAMCTDMNMVNTYHCSWKVLCEPAGHIWQSLLLS